MQLLVATWSIPLEKRSACYTCFANMTDEDHANDKGPGVKELCRYHNMANGTGASIMEATDAEAAVRYLWNWSEEMATVKVKPMIDDNELREILLKQPPSFTNEYCLQDPLREGESYYLGHYKFYPDKKEEGYKIFANMTMDQEDADPGEVRNLGRFHDLGEGSGIFICAAKSSKDIHKWMGNWCGMAEGYTEPVVTDQVARDLTRAKPGYDRKLAMLMYG